MHVIKMIQLQLTQACARLLPFCMGSWIKNRKFIAPCDLEIKQLEINVSTQYGLEKKNMMRIEYSCTNLIQA